MKVVTSVSLRDGIDTLMMKMVMMTTMVITMMTTPTVKTETMNEERLTDRVNYTSH